MIALAGHPSTLVASGLAACLAQRLGYREVFPVQDTEDLLTAAAETRPDLAVVDVDLAIGEETAICRAMIELDVPLVMISREEAGNHLALLEAGAGGIALADDGIDGIVEAAKAVLKGNAYVPPRLLGDLLHDLIVQRRTQDRTSSLVARLSPREREVLALVSAGADQRQIAGALDISPLTAKTHIHRLLQKLEVRSRVEAAALASTLGIVPTLELADD
jgi:two-component system, NarL family, response regulator DevR